MLEMKGVEKNETYSTSREISEIKMTGYIQTGRPEFNSLLCSGLLLKPIDTGDLENRPLAPIKCQG
jgi:hypothetical protein